MTALATNRADLPEKWERVFLGDISCDINYGYTASSTDEPIGPRMLRITDIQDNAVNWKTVPYCKIDDNEVDKYLLSPNDIVFARTGATVGKSFLIPSNVSNSVYASYLIRVKLEDGIDPKYISYFFQSGDYWSQIRKNQAGIGQPNVNGSKLKKLEVPLAPPEQQERIVAKIEELFSHIDAGIKALKKAKQLLKQYRQSVLKAAVTGELTKVWRETNKDKLEPASQLLERILKERRLKWEKQQLEQFKAKGKMPKDDKWKGKYKLEEPNPHMILDIPSEWALSTLESITDPVRVICYGILMPKENIKDGVLYVKVKDIKGGEVLLHQLNRTAPEIAKKYERASLKEGDLLLTIRGTYGRTAIAPAELEGGNITQDTVRISAISPITNEYIQLFIDSNVAQHYFKLVARGVAVKGVNVQDVRNMNVSIPGREEQDVIAGMVDEKITSLSHLENELEVQLIKAEKNKQSILASAFSGKLIENVDSDESVKGLLERIAREKSLATSKGKLIKRKVTKKRGKIVAKKPIIDVLKDARSPMDVDELFELSGYASDLTAENIEKFYGELKEAVEISNVEVIEEIELGKKQGDIFVYKA